MSRSRRSKRPDALLERPDHKSEYQLTDHEDIVVDSLLWRMPAETLIRVLSEPERRKGHLGFWAQDLATDEKIFISLQHFAVIAYDDDTWNPWNWLELVKA